MLTIRPGSPNDAQDIIGVHHSAVHELASATYDSRILEDWSPPAGPDRIEQMKGVIAGDVETIIVAESEGKVVGFGSIAIDSGEVLAVYISADHAGHGIGSAILAELERLALENGLTELNLASSTNAESFYLHRGYVVFRRGEHTLRSGLKMEASFMHKQL